MGRKWQETSLVDERALETAVLQNLQSRTGSARLHATLNIKIGVEHVVKPSIGFYSGAAFSQSQLFLR